MRLPLKLLKPLFGIEVEIVDSRDRNLKGIRGKIVFESRNMFGILKDDHRIVFVPKSICIFKLSFGVKKIIVHGDLLENRFMKLRKVGRRRKRSGRGKNAIISKT